MELSEAGQAFAAGVAERHQVSTAAVAELLRALAAGQGTQAQFSHPELGGMGQWSRGGMVMVGDMFNTGLKAKVDALCTELSAAVLQGDMFAAARSTQSQSQSGGAPGVSLFVSGSGWWPGDLGVPSSTGSQNDLRYGFFPATQRLAVDIGGAVTVYDTGDHVISGVSQQQGGDRTLSFRSQHGLVRLADLPVVSGETVRAQASAERPAVQPTAERAAVEPARAAAPERAPEAPVAGGGAVAEADVFAKLERVAELHAKGILSQSEFEAKKAELLARI